MYVMFRGGHIPENNWNEYLGINEFVWRCSMPEEVGAQLGILHDKVGFQTYLGDGNNDSFLVLLL
jgi:gamma-glutamylcysteine synthetase